LASSLSLDWDGDPAAIDPGAGAWIRSGLTEPARRSEIRVNRAPVLTLWAAVVAERLGQDLAITLSRMRAGPAGTG